MSVVRSPTGSGSRIERSDSQPSLRDLQLAHTDNLKVSSRSKRKQLDDTDHILSELSELRKQMSEMMAMLVSLNTTQNEFRQKINEDITDIKEQITCIKSVTDILAVEQSEIKSELVNLRNNCSTTEKQQLNNRKRALIFGDFNINLLTKNRATVIYKEVIQESGYEILNKIDEKYCTRETAMTKSIIDHVCSNIKQNKFHVAIIETPMSDHKQIYIEMKRYHQEPLQKVSYQAVDYNLLYNTISQYQSSNFEHTYSILEEKLVNCIKYSKITKYKILNPPRKNWINNTIISHINNRNKLWNEHKRNPDDTNKKDLFINKRNEVTDYIQKTKSKYYFKAFIDCKNQPTKMWELINSLSQNKLKGNNTPKKIQMQNGQTTDDENEICECFNNFFYTAQCFKNGTSIQQESVLSKFV
ncbi:unnamed protein product [Euphydryas editha]|uniref:Tick transposon n=1 Tax=Euphydryas editha TaxID=104508 RepID=A0AAU9TNK3_EUPED|nr:unnamed protein product [Euphydryas editha]